jgi:hypothetical protein
MLEGIKSGLSTLEELAVELPGVNPTCKGSPDQAVELLSRGFTPMEKISVEETAMQLSSIIEKERREFRSLIYGNYDI